LAERPAEGFGRVSDSVTPADQHRVGSSPGRSLSMRGLLNPRLFRWGDGRYAEPYEPTRFA